MVNHYNGPGGVSIGKHVKGVKFFQSYIDLKSAAITSTSTIWRKEEIKYYTFQPVYPSKHRPDVQLQLKPGITYNVVNLTSDFSAVFENWSDDLFSGFPKSWTIEYVRRNLKPKLSPRSGWGMDVIGYLGDTCLNTAIALFLDTVHPSLRKWDSLLNSINEYIPVMLSKLRVRVVE